MKHLLLVILLFTLASCGAVKYIEKEVPVEIEKVRTEYINQYYKDSIYIHDSIDRYISGDTVYLSKYKYIYKYFNSTDTLIQHDSIEKPVEVKTTEIKEVNKLKWYQKFLILVGTILGTIAIYKVVIYIKGKLK